MGLTTFCKVMKYWRFLWSEWIPKGTEDKKKQRITSTKILVDCPGSQSRHSLEGWPPRHDLHSSWHQVVHSCTIHTRKIENCHGNLKRRKLKFQPRKEIPVSWEWNSPDLGAAEFFNFNTWQWTNYSKRLFVFPYYVKDQIYIFISKIHTYIRHHASIKISFVKKKSTTDALTRQESDIQIRYKSSLTIDHDKETW